MPSLVRLFTGRNEGLLCCLQKVLVDAGINSMPLGGSGIAREASYYDGSACNLNGSSLLLTRDDQQQPHRISRGLTGIAMLTGGHCRTQKADGAESRPGW